MGAVLSGPAGENAWNRAVVEDPSAGVGAHPADHLDDGLIFGR